MEYVIAQLAYAIAFLDLMAYHVMVGYFSDYITIKLQQVFM